MILKIAKITANRYFVTGKIDDHLYGTFLEHIHTIIYGCLYQPGHPQADKYGFRKDVTSLLKELGTTFLRYPGGRMVLVLRKKVPESMTWPGRRRKAIR